MSLYENVHYVRSLSLVILPVDDGPGFDGGVAGDGVVVGTRVNGMGGSVVVMGARAGGQLPPVLSELEIQVL